MEEATELRYECPWCDRSFSSGKGLGGHKRVHTTINREKNQRLEEMETSCPICKKSFSSVKSLHGHMRKHPDRSWRGMRPPPPPVDKDSVSVAHNLLALAKNHFRFACDLCGKQFGSYQALGGHKSHHGLKLALARPQGFVYGGGGGGGGGVEGEKEKGKMLMLTFDLNELPPED